VHAASATLWYLDENRIEFDSPVAAHLRAHAAVVPPPQRYSHPIPKHLLSASRFVEQGYAMALGKRIYVVGGLDESGKTQPFFDELASVTHVKDFAEFVQMLTLVEAA
jgi:hypothetical protein